MERAKIKQCASCPWRVGCDPSRDIPNGYSVELHQQLRLTIAAPGQLNLDKLPVTACHHSKPGKEFACAGWLHNQLGAGNNIGLRIAVTRGHMPAPVVDGPQHETFDETLCAEGIMR